MTFAERRFEGPTPGAQRARCAAKGVWPLLLCLWAGSLARAQGDDPSRYAAVADIELLSTEGLQRIELSLPVLQASRSPGYADVRIFDARGQLVPMAWLQATPVVQEHTRKVAVPAFAWPDDASRHTAAAALPTTHVQITAAGAVVRIEGAAASAPRATSPSAWLLDLSALTDPSEHLMRLMLDWPSQPGGVAAAVQVEASDDARIWSAVMHGSLLDLSSSGAPMVKHLEWPLAGRPPRYLRLSVDTPLPLSRAEVVVSSRSDAQTARAAQHVNFLIDASARELPQPWLLDLQGTVPLSQLHVLLPQTNTVLPLRLEQRDLPTQAWRHVVDLTAWRLTRGGRELVSPAVPFTAAAARYWRLVPQSRHSGVDTMALAATVEWTPPQLVFTARGVATSGPIAPGAFRLAVGRPGMAPGAATLALSTLAPGQPAGGQLQWPLATVGALAQQAVAEPALTQQLRQASAADLHRWVLWAVLAGAVLVLALLAWRLLRELNQTTPP